MSDSKENKAITGGEFIIRDVSCDEIFTPEDWTEDHLMMKLTAKDFVNSRVVPNLEAIDNQEEGLMPKLLEESGGLGLLSSSIPESLGGLGMDFKLSLIHI